ncbi:hypothetical protein BO94DRAFT_583883 [Aspergillus sclerotioniger CBS 115572]|uniref:Uncharacterized protein n=1 Tax=Aspergillus sclerotioniger CBS 115572 TaxID=1450535 RepID=A0A317X007_9EURO|nr:hypothetical protein BO94DRAFT_583883 [Aspergillus sclerotioniger CBS 115572]PWY91974.1 hypothetical protein BO94DRAFT_583883 [Aspergillus sclerotioniger CBS 115572]
MNSATQIIKRAIFLPGSVVGAGPRHNKTKVEKKKKEEEEERKDIKKMSKKDREKEIERLQAAILKEEEEIRRKREKIVALEGVMGDGEGGSEEAEHMEE